MTNTPSITARAVLFGYAAREVVESELAERLRENGVERLAFRRVPAASAMLQSTALREIARAVDGLLAVDIGGVTVAGWRRYEQLRDAAMRTSSGGVEQVELYEHEITQTYCPRLDLTVDGNRVGEFEVELNGTVLLRPLTATVRDGMLVALGPGDCTVTISISVPELGPVLEREREFPVGIMVDLRRPIPLIGHPPRAVNPDR
ncbi:hypothetical protein [Nocardia mexicana]|uniref:Uncharacterized protein n=1 Tax=Nocardia mexicana TaxID=279262 RepID=A0A370GV01_9NOCA|nr:hypothetical protein [Nocardia mexicana]RDI47090.1 hypothetical protein DFR68_10988 [Nocardia mexicana]